MRNDFDLSATCGVWQCQECWECWYPMELDQEEELDLCPQCLGKCFRLSAIGIASVQLMWNLAKEDK